MISSRGFPKFQYCFSLADRKKLYKICGKEVQSSYKSLCGKALIKFQTEKLSVMHTKHDCTKSQRQDSRENETIWELPYLLVPSSGYKNEIAIGPDSRSCKVLGKRD